MDYVFHLGAVISAPDRRTYFDVNTQGTRNIAEACIDVNPGLRKFVYVSSISAAGPSPCDALLNEESECHRVSEYGRSKLAAEEVVLSLADRLPVTIVGPERPRTAPEGARRIDQAPPDENQALDRPEGLPDDIAAVGDIVRALVLAAEDPRSAGGSIMSRMAAPIPGGRSPTPSPRRWASAGSICPSRFPFNTSSRLWPKARPGFSKGRRSFPASSLPPSL